MSDNKITNRLSGIALVGSSNNRIFHNSFIDNQYQAQISESYNNTWDNDYPSGGNYWSDHNSPDDNRDKIGDTQYTINENNIDRYPLVYPHDHKPNPDVNGDGLVNIIDIAIVAKAFSSYPGHASWNPMADMDPLDEVINIVDVSKVARQFGKEWEYP